MDSIGLPLEWQTALKEADWDLFSSYGALLILACTVIYSGSMSSVSFKSDTEKDEDEEEILEHVSSNDAKWFPFIASGALLGLYLVIKYLGKEWINWLLGWYFSVMGVGSVWKASISFVRFIIGSARWKSFDSWSMKVKRGPKDMISLSCRTPALFLLPVSLLPSVLNSWFPGRKWTFLMGDIVGVSFCHNTIALLKLDTFYTGVVLLGGLFIYDIWWVFGTRVMVEVATTLDVPIKLLWPKSLEFATARGYTLLGLGDIVIPGIFVALALRFDYWRNQEKIKDTSIPPTMSFPKPYFYATLMAYTMGLVTTMGVMHIFRVAQPALLYLSPACTLSLVGMALARGELDVVWKWSDHSEDEKAGGEETEEKEKTHESADDH